jgi:hypothetical protein
MATAQQLTEAYNRLSTRLIDQAGNFAVAAFNGLGSWRDADAQRYEALMGRTLGGIKRQAVNLQVGYYRAMAQIAEEPFVAPTIPASSLTTSALRNGADTRTVYNRPFVSLYTGLDSGRTFTESLLLGAQRARSLATTEVQLARRIAGRDSRGANDRIVGYLRVLTGRENCALCYVASTQRYTRGDLLPIHPGCDCGERPIYGNTDPGQVIDEQLLEATHEAVEERFGISDRGARAIDYRQITIRDHGELGPVLTVKGQHFTGPSDL